MARRWVITGGGTGGHVTPALALGEAIVDRGDEVLFIGSSRGLESRLVPDAGFDLRVLPSEQVMGRSLARSAARAPSRSCRASAARSGSSGSTARTP